MNKQLADGGWALSGATFNADITAMVLQALYPYRDDIKIDVIAFAIGDRDANNQLKCVSLVTSGKFYNANTAAELKDSLKDSLNLQKEVQGVIIQK